MGAVDSIREELEKKNEYILFLQEENKRLSETLASLVETIAKKEEIDAKKRHDIQAKGIERAMKNGVKFGRPAHPLPPNFDAVYKEWKLNKISTSEAARRTGMPYSSFVYRVRHYE